MACETGLTFDMLNMGQPQAESLEVGFANSLRPEFNGSKLASDAGLLTYRDLDDALRLFDSTSTVFTDKWTGRNVQHERENLLRQSVYSSFGRILLRSVAGEIETVRLKATCFIALENKTTSLNYNPKSYQLMKACNLFPVSLQLIIMAFILSSFSATVEAACPRPVRKKYFPSRVRSVRNSVKEEYPEARKP